MLDYLENHTLLRYHTLLESQTPDALDINSALQILINIEN